MTVGQPVGRCMSAAPLAQGARVSTSYAEELYEAELWHSHQRRMLDLAAVTEQAVSSLRSCEGQQSAGCCASPGLPSMGSRHFSEPMGSRCAAEPSVPSLSMHSGAWPSSVQASPGAAQRSGRPMSPTRVRVVAGRPPPSSMAAPAQPVYPQRWPSPMPEAGATQSWARGGVSPTPVLRYRDARCVPVPVAAASGAFDGAPVAVGSSTQLMPAAATRAALSRQSSYTPPQSGAMSVQASSAAPSVARPSSPLCCGARTPLAPTWTVVCSDPRPRPQRSVSPPWASNRGQEGATWNVGVSSQGRGSITVSAVPASGRPVVQTREVSRCSSSYLPGVRQSEPARPLGAAEGEQRLGLVAALSQGSLSLPPQVGPHASSLSLASGARSVPPAALPLRRSLSGTATAPGPAPASIRGSPGVALAAVSESGKVAGRDKEKPLTVTCAQTRPGANSAVLSPSASATTVASVPPPPSSTPLPPGASDIAGHESPGPMRQQRSQSSWAYLSDGEMRELAEQVLRGLVAPSLLQRLSRREVVSLLAAQFEEDLGSADGGLGSPAAPPPRNGRNGEEAANSTLGATSECLLPTERAPMPVEAADEPHAGAKFVPPARFGGGGAWGVAPPRPSDEEGRCLTPPGHRSVVGIVGGILAPGAGAYPEDEGDLGGAPVRTAPWYDRRSAADCTEEPIGLHGGKLVSLALPEDAASQDAAPQDSSEGPAVAADETDSAGVDERPQHACAAPGSASSSTCAGNPGVGHKVVAAPSRFALHAEQWHVGAVAPACIASAAPLGAGAAEVAQRGWTPPTPPPGGEHLARAARAAQSLRH